MLLETTRFPTLRWLEGCAATIRSEACGIPLEEFSLWSNADAFTGTWSCLPLVCQWDSYEFTLDAEKARRLAPRSVDLLAGRPEIVAAGISVMLPGARILPHVDLRTEGVIRGHFGLEIPSKSAIRVGPNLERWEEGKVLIFDGRIDHETINMGDTPRIVLLVDFYLSEDEQAYLDETNSRVDRRWLISGAGENLFTGEDL